MKKKYFFVILFLTLAIFLSGCSGMVTPDPDGVGGDFYICENLLRGYYTALSNRNYTQALSYCKPGGVMYKFANSMWDLALDYPKFYHTYQVYNVYDFSHPTSYYVNAEYDFSTTQHDIYGGMYGTKYYYGFAAPFEKVYGQWKLS
ncbi:hypothetical protein ES695_12485 [Candidatus Atribacteria bacterium 1244-E10-H5-B2]|nr:MAG: hypothetical protein ES695_12485 [Candidatus Atribacteria bacterium 1244-E10-H5-B2]